MESNMSISALLKKTEHYDKDERYMATSDLCEVLKRKNISTEQRSICTAVLRLLHDKSHDVQAIAVKTLGVLLQTLCHSHNNNQSQVLEIADSLTDQVLDTSKTELRDVYAIGLRTLCKTVPSSMGPSVSQRILGRLLEGIRSTVVLSSSSTNANTDDSKNRSDDDSEIALACLDIIGDMLARFTSAGGAASGSTLESTSSTNSSTSNNSNSNSNNNYLQLQHAQILEMCLQCLTQTSSSAVRKRAGTTMGVLSTVLSDAHLQHLVDKLLSHIDDANNNNGNSSIDTRALIRTICTVSGAVGHRLGQVQIDKIIPIFLRFTNPQEATNGDQDDDDIISDDDDNNNNNNNDNDSRNNNNGNNTEAATALANELRESCFMGFESFVLKCPVQVEPHLEQIIQAALAYMQHDPNYSYGSDDDDDANNNEDMADADGDNDYSDDDEYDDDSDMEDDDEDDDDDDESWKVRRGAIRALKAVVECKQHDPTMLWKTPYQVRLAGSTSNSTVVAAALVNRFKEREENCRVGIVDCFNRLLQVTVEAHNAGVIRLADDDDNAMSDDSTTIIDLQQSYAPKVVKASEKVLKVKKGHERSKSSALALLATLCQVGIGNQATIASVFEHVQVFLNFGNNSNSSSDHHHHHRETTSKALQLDALSLVSAMLSCNSHSLKDVRLSLEAGSLLPELCRAVQEQWYKVIAEALRALACVPRFFVDGGDNSASDDQKRKVADMLYQAMEPVLAATDVDQEIKECVLHGTASLLVSLHLVLKSEQNERLLKLLLERLGNETTRITAMKALVTIAANNSDADNTQSTEKVDLTCVLAAATQSVAGFLKLQSRSSKQSALEALDVIVKNHGSHKEFADGTLFAGILKEFTVIDSDLHLSNLALNASVSVLSACPAAGAAVKELILPQALEFATSSLVQDAALESLLTLFRAIVKNEAVPPAELLGMMSQRLEKVGQTTNSNNKHAVYNLAKCIAAVATSSSTENMQSVLNDAIQELEAAKPQEEGLALRRVQLLLLQTGDIGREVDLAQTGLADRLKTIYLRYFDSPSEELKSAAAYALGNASVGAQATFLPSIVGKLDEDNRRQQYLLLSSLREYIQSSSRGGKSVAESLAVILPPLEKHCSDEEEGARTMVAECMGSLTVLHPSELLKKLGELLASHSTINSEGGFIPEGDKQSKENALVCWTLATSIKNAASSKVDAEELANHMPTFLALLNEEELQVRLAALQMTYSLVYHCPQAVAGPFKDIISPALYTVSDLVMKRKVNLGPFTHTKDDALQLRVTALSIFATSLAKVPGSIDVVAFMPVLAKALGDTEDIQLHAHQIVISMCTRHPIHICNAVDSFVEPLEKTTNKKEGQKTGTELDRFHDWIKSAIRVTLTISKLEGAMGSRKFADFVDRIKINPKHSSTLEALNNER